MSGRRLNTVRDCACPQARHQHGTYAAYNKCGCRCRSCADAALVRRQVQNGTLPFVVDVEITIARHGIYGAMRRLGLTYEQVAPVLEGMR